MAKTTHIISYIAVIYFFIGIVNLYKEKFPYFNFTLLPQAIFAVTIASVLFALSDLIVTIFCYCNYVKNYSIFGNETFIDVNDIDKKYRISSNVEFPKLLMWLSNFLFSIAIPFAIILLFLIVLPSQIIMDSITMFTFGFFILDFSFKKIVYEIKTQLYMSYIREKSIIMGK